MEAAFLFLELAVVLAMIFIGARVGSIGLGMYGMVGVFLLVFVFGMEPGNIPIDVMLIIVAVITASSALQAAGGLDYMVEAAARFLRKHPSHITFYAPLTTWLFCILAGTAHTSYALLPIISEISLKAKIRPERPLSVAAIAASLGITGSPVSAATAAILSQSLLGAHGVGMSQILVVTIPSSLVAILVAALVQNFIGKPLEQDPEYQRRLQAGHLEEEDETEKKTVNPRAKWAVLVFLLGVVLVVLFGSFPSLRPAFNGSPISMNSAIEIIMMSIAALILLVGKADVKKAVKGNVFSAGMVAMVSIFGIAWMGSTFFEGNKDLIIGAVGGLFTQWPMLFAIPLFLMSIMLFSQAATVKTLYPVGLALGIPPMILLALFPAVNGYFFLPNYPTQVAAIGFDRTGTTKIGKYVINHSFQLAGFITTVVSIGLGYLIIQFL
ncbi:MAG: anaerobic C4-dicarboxylate transporter [Bacteroidales bacterium]|nr:anaerobic C4-dicarboxylate transporter [Bacteroidales bacterium]MBQ2331149.1 anaerobic C4-dicarboxylate transporter [Bacteroidales bacterium]MBQ7611208.1 anaerobic C4-dicarboxylate transporter [Bacteroidales bacterium]